MKKRTITIFTLLLGLFLALAALAGAYSLTKLPEEHFAKKVRIHGLSFEQANSFEQISEEMRQKEKAFLESNTLWTSERGNLEATPMSLGAQASPEEVYKEIEHFMEQSSALEKIRSALFGKSFELPIAINTAMLESALQASGLEQESKSAVYAYEASDVVIVPEELGYIVERELLVQQLQDHWNDGLNLPKEDVLPMTIEEPNVLTADLESHLEEAKKLMGLTLTFRDRYSSTWDLSLSGHIDWFVPTEEGFTFSRELFSAYLNENIAPDVEMEMQNATIIENEDGSYDFEGSARFGEKINHDATLDAVEIKLARLHENEATLANEVQPATESPEETSLDEEPELAEEEEEEDWTIDLIIDQTDPEVTVPQSLQDRGVVELLGYGYSDFSGSPYNRIHNVNLGMQTFSGVIVEQGEEFSFTSLMGPITAAYGWKPELVIKGDETIPEYGGGLCQVSSTMYRAALYLGLPITNRKNHSYAVSYYAYPNGYGLDATIYDPAPDLRFLNDTPGDILIQGYTEGNNAYFVFYGTNDGRSMQMEGPYTYDFRGIPASVTEYTDQLEPGTRILDAYGHTGFKVDWYRTVTHADGTQGEKETIHSNYEARPARYLEGSSGEETSPSES